MAEYKLLINGELVNSSTGKTSDDINPATGEVIAQVPESTLDDMNRAVAAARAAFDDGRWSGLTHATRASMLEKLATLVEEHADELAELESQDTGKPIKLARDSDIPFAADNLHFFASTARHLRGSAASEYSGGHTSIIRREPIGVVASVAPWNYPFMMAAWKLGPALAAGNTVVFKPSPETPLTALKLGELAIEAGIPAGVLNILADGPDVAPSLVSHKNVNMVSITGSTRSGKYVMRAAADTIKRAHLELGGKAPFIVYADADIEAAANGAVVGGYVNCGQDCTAATRIYVQDSIYDDFIASFLSKVKQIRVGNPASEQTDMGPLISARQLDRVQGYVERARHTGSHILVGGQHPSIAGLEKGFFFEPTVIAEERQDAEIVQEEVFGPVVVVSRFTDEEEALHCANGVVYGLAASVWTRDIYKAMRASQTLQFGTVWVNDHLPLTSEMPHGGYKESGIGKDMSMYSFEEYTQIKHVMIELSGEARKDWHYTIFGDQA
ncbi:gamma-aminobutyraldehyde dehydrogenase [Ktedonosporobacter rubrisoli]|uniref:Gamma-aminobutyraldehyde dehydrogenase n=1 Tax=Ktedonosporobacter rubrisoli TaxID=2509675 RepID=A0A4P6K1U1_KTERU|nr:gamma-aminobutyraldehyde dehydrogenase [Ktedonosporobacter rubrisoli]QBD81803.1 gamma-aminobutyraldehyde dehydrogenase [Ktedonosporobacter rubrisoli]